MLHMDSCIRLNSFNTRGLCNDKKRRCIFNWLKKSHVGIIFLQETHSTIDCEDKWAKEYGSKIIFSHGTSKSRVLQSFFLQKSTTQSIKL